MSNPKNSVSAGIPPRDFQTRLRQMAVYYATSAPGFELLMDDLSVTCDDEQWEEVERVTREIDEWLVDEGVASVAVTERVLAKREGRRMRLNKLLVAPADWERLSQSIALEFRQKGIRFQDVLKK